MGERTDIPGEVFGVAGGPAFPISIRGCGDNGAHGMSLRDYFAGRAMQAITEAEWTREDYNDLARRAYNIADAMLAKRNERP